MSLFGSAKSAFFAYAGWQDDQGAEFVLARWYRNEVRRTAEVIDQLGPTEGRDRAFRGIHFDFPDEVARQTIALHIFKVASERCGL